MATLTMQINSMVEHLQEPEQVLVFEIIKRFLPDDVATPEDLSDIALAREEHLQGETIKESDIDWS
jgi:2-phospho-L-lactate guanylyltransferase (CobY/MobA/RfbA family)